MREVHVEIIRNRCVVVLSTLLLKSCLFVTLVSLIGCATVRTEVHNGTVETLKDLNERAVGVAYFLPKRRVRLDVSRELVPFADIGQRITEARAVRTQATSRSQSANEALGVATARYAAIQESAPEAARQVAASQFNAARAAATNATSNLQRARARVTELETARNDALRLNGKSQNCPVPLNNLSLTLLPMEPDPEFLLRANLDHWWVRDDELTIAVNNRGLLTSTELATTDQTGEILTQIVRTAAFFSGAAPVSPGGNVSLALKIEEDSGDAGDKCKQDVGLQPLREERIFDPTSLVELYGINTFLENNSLPFCIAVDDVAPGSENTQCKEPVAYINGESKKKPLDKHARPPGYQSNSAAKLLGKPPSSKTVNGFMYRPNLPHKIDVIAVTDAKNKPRYRIVDSSIIFLPNKGPVTLAPTTTGALVTTEYELMFEDGVLISWRADRPSELLEIVRLPLSIVDGVFESLSRLIPFQTQQVNNQTDLLEANLRLIEAQGALQELLDSQAQEALLASEEE